MPATRTEHDSLGPVEVPADALYGAQTQRAVTNFTLSAQRFPREFIAALALIKAAAARVHAGLGLLPTDMAAAIESAAREVAQGLHDDHFPLDVYQTGSGTSTNMNANEVIATLASRRLGRPVHPNDDVNRGQSSNDVIPTAIHLSAYQQTAEHLLPALNLLHAAITNRAATLDHVVKNGRTHLMDALPLRMSQELSGWAAQLQLAMERIDSALPHLAELALGGTAIGTGVNTHPEFAARAAAALAQDTGLPLKPSRNFFASLASQDTAVELHGHLKTTAVALMKIANDLRWMNSGPLSGLAEIELPALQPGSSIMPGKVNPVIPEALAMAAARVMGNDVTMTIAGQSGNFQLNVMLPVLAVTLLESLRLIAGSADALAPVITGFRVNELHLAQLAGRNPILGTLLNPVIGYEAAAKLVKQAIAQGRTIQEVAREAGVPVDALDPRLATGA